VSLGIRDLRVGRLPALGARGPPAAGLTSGRPHRDYGRRAEKIRRPPFIALGWDHIPAPRVSRAEADFADAPAVRP